MQIKSLTLKNFRGFKDTEITFSEGLTVLVGVNGAGKSSVLDALAMMLSQITDHIRQEHALTWSPKETDIHQGTNEFSVETQVHFEGRDFKWMTGLFRNGRSVAGKIDPIGRQNLVDDLVGCLAKPESQIALPILVYYPVNRAVPQVPVPPPEDDSCFDLMEAYLESTPNGAVDFHSFFKWFRAREDLENERRLRGQIALEARDRDLEVVRRTIKTVLPEINSPIVKRLPEALVVEKNGLEIRLDRLSDGEKLLFALAGDLARRIALANPSMDNPLHGEGVVLIDEIEQHLHPAWQRTIIGNLRRTFPNVQFIVSTHSPQVLGEVPREQIRVLSSDAGGRPVVSIPYRSRGLDSSQILKEVFEAPDRNEDVQRQLDAIFAELDRDDTKSLARARKKIDKLRKELRGEIPELIEAESMLFMLEAN